MAAFSFARLAHSCEHHNEDIFSIQFQEEYYYKVKQGLNLGHTITAVTHKNTKI